MTVGCPDISGDGNPRIIQYDTSVSQRCRDTVLRLRVAEENAVFIAGSKTVSEAGAAPDVQPLRPPFRSKLHEIELRSDLGVMDVHQMVSVGFGRHAADIHAR